MNKYFLLLTIIGTLFIQTNLFGEAPQDTWLIMLYQDADDYQLEEDIFIDMNEAENIGSTKKVTIVSQCDRYADGFDGDGDWNGTRRFKPKKGDSFTILETWIEIDDKGNTINVQEQGGTLTFGKNPVEWYDFDAYPGAYVIGFIVEDFDGNVFEEYTSLEVVE